MQNNYYPQNNPQYTPYTIQDGGLVSVRNEMEARTYPIQYGKSVMFKDENAPYIYTKTMGFSQLDRPVFEKYRLVKEENSSAEETKKPQTDNLAFEDLKRQIETIKEDVEDIKKKMKDIEVTEYDA